MNDDCIENEVRTKQSLELFKNWLAKHPFIRFDGEDNIDELLMYFLRIKKFVMDRVYECFEFSVIFIKSHEDWYKNPGPADYEFTNKPNSPLIFMKKRDAQGRRIMIYKIKYFDSFEKIEFFRTVFLTPYLVIFELETQLNGAVVLMDFRDMHLGKFKQMPIHSIYDSFKVTKNGMLRLQQCNLIGMPSFVKPIFEVGKSFTSAKIVERINLIHNVEDLSKVMDVSFLPKEYGGTSDELLDYEVFQSGVSFMNIINKFHVNFSKIQEFESVGSFRKLEID